MKWQFTPKRRSDKTRDPIASEFFSLDAIRDAGDALIREGIQNSLDARLNKKTGVARVRLYVSGAEGALKAEELEPWTLSLWPHLLARGNGIMPGTVTESTTCNFLVFEDFETTGLTGDYRSFEAEDGERNSFFYFFRAEGRTAKSGDDRGRWGIGKQVFPRSSKAQIYFGYTETGSNSLLMGGCVLRHHKPTDSNITYKPDGYFGIQEELDGDPFTLPIQSPAAISSFCRTFNLTRKPGATGLSIVVPWLDDTPEEGGAFDSATLAFSVMSDYFVPIIENKLEVTIESPSENLHISSESYSHVIANLQERYANQKPAAKRLARLQSMLRLARMAHNGSRNELLMFDLPPCPTARAEWKPSMLPEETAREMRNGLDSGKTLCVTASLTVRPKNLAQAESHFKCFLVKSDSNERPCHIREDLLISNVDCKALPGFSALIRIEDGPLAALLGDSEGPAHTEWQGSSRNFKDKYVNGSSAIRFVSTFATELLSRIYAAQKQLDRELLSDLFHDVSTPAPKMIKPATNNKKDAANDQDDKADGGHFEIASNKRPFRLEPLDDGFSLSNNEEGADSSFAIVVKAAYDSTKGDPFKCYQPNDFSFSKRVIQFEYTGCTHTITGDNSLLIKPVTKCFSFKARGFDTNRDLVVKANLAAAPGVSN